MHFHKRLVKNDGGILVEQNVLPVKRNATPRPRSGYHCDVGVVHECPRGRTLQQVARSGSVKAWQWGREQRLNVIKQEARLIRHVEI